MRLVRGLLRERERDLFLLSALKFLYCAGLKREYNLAIASLILGFVRLGDEQEEGSQLSLPHMVHKLRTSFS